MFNRSFIMQILTKSVLVATLCCLFAMPVAQAKSNGVSKNQAVRTATSKYPGKVVKISNNKATYRIRVLQKNGRVITVTVDKKSGRIK